MDAQSLIDTAQLDADAAFHDEFGDESELAAPASSTEQGTTTLPPFDPEASVESHASVDSDVELAAGDDFEQDFADEFDDEFGDEFGVDASPHITVRSLVAFSFLCHKPSLFLPHSSNPNTSCCIHHLHRFWPRTGTATTRLRACIARWRRGGCE